MSTALLTKSDPRDRAFERLYRRHVHEVYRYLLAVLRNQAPLPAAGGNHWLGVELRGRDNRDVVGAKLVLEGPGGRQTRFAVGGGSYLSSGDPRHRFGLGREAKAGRLTVAWPSGEPRAQHWDGLEADRYWRLVQGKGAAEPARAAGSTQ